MSRPKATRLAPRPGKKKRKRPRILRMPIAQPAPQTEEELDELALEHHALGRALYRMPGTEPAITPSVRQAEIAIASGFKAQNATDIPPVVLELAYRMRALDIAGANRRLT